MALDYQKRDVGATSKELVPTIYDLVMRAGKRHLAGDQAVSSCLRKVRKLKTPKVIGAASPLKPCLTVYSNAPDFALVNMESTVDMLRDGDTLLVVWSMLDTTPIQKQHIPSSQKAIPSAYSAEQVDIFGVVAVSGGIHNNGKQGWSGPLPEKEKNNSEHVDSKFCDVKSAENTPRASHVTVEQLPSVFTASTFIPGFEDSQSRSTSGIKEIMGCDAASISEHLPSATSSRSATPTPKQIQTTSEPVTPSRPSRSSSMAPSSSSNKRSHQTGSIASVVKSAKPLIEGAISSFSSLRVDGIGIFKSGENEENGSKDPDCRKSSSVSEERSISVASNQDSMSDIGSDLLPDDTISLHLSKTTSAMSTPEEAHLNRDSIQSFTSAIKEVSGHMEQVLDSFTDGISLIKKASRTPSTATTVTKASLEKSAEIFPVHSAIVADGSSNPVQEQESNPSPKPHPHSILSKSSIYTLDSMQSKAKAMAASALHMAGGLTTKSTVSISPQQSDTPPDTFDSTIRHETHQPLSSTIIDFNSKHKQAVQTLTQSVASSIHSKLESLNGSLHEKSSSVLSQDRNKSVGILDALSKSSCSESIQSMAESALQFAHEVAAMNHQDSIKSFQTDSSRSTIQTRGINISHRDSNPLDSQSVIPDSSQAILDSKKSSQTIIGEQPMAIPPPPTHHVSPPLQLQEEYNKHALNQADPPASEKSIHQSFAEKLSAIADSTSSKISSLASVLKPPKHLKSESAIEQEEKAGTALGSKEGITSESAASPISTGSQSLENPQQQLEKSGFLGKIASGIKGSFSGVSSSSHTAGMRLLYHLVLPFETIKFSFCSDSKQSIVSHQSRQGNQSASSSTFSKNKFETPSKILNETDNPEKDLFRQESQDFKYTPDTPTSDSYENMFQPDEESTDELSRISQSMSSDHTKTAEGKASLKSSTFAIGKVTNSTNEIQSKGTIRESGFDTGGNNRSGSRNRHNSQEESIHSSNSVARRSSNSRDEISMISRNSSLSSKSDAQHLSKQSSRQSSDKSEKYRPVTIPNSASQQASISKLKRHTIQSSSGSDASVSTK
ncbi:hypothetical protein BDR26DRAFT_902005 [Obelidium mucronatum]|nr:hypothetical protein BDR26DRAFT_902005 [Obelidium mucronatum]